MNRYKGYLLDLYTADRGDSFEGGENRIIKYSSVRLWVRYLKFRDQLKFLSLISNSKNDRD